jgi:hypothetical protein
MENRLQRLVTAKVHEKIFGKEFDLKKKKKKLIVFCE